jgi:multidrug efflux pump subunit AcrA (membrane-fusion protein)
MKKYSKKKKWIAVGMSVVLIGGAAGGIFFRSRSRSFQAMAENVAVQSAVVEKGDISTTVVGTGNLESTTAEDVTMPSGLKVEKVLVESGDSVKKGDTLATVDAASVKQAMLETQEEIEELDEEVEEAKDDETSSYITAGVSGTVKKIYARTGKEAGSIMAKKGALLVIQMDDDSGTEIKVTAAAGTISKIYVSEGDSVSAGDKLFYLEDVGESAEYLELVAQRQELASYMQELSEIATTNKITATFDGIVQDVNVSASTDSGSSDTQSKSVSTVQTSAVQSTSASTATVQKTAAKRTTSGIVLCSTAAVKKTAVESESETASEQESESESGSEVQKISIGSIKDLVTAPVTGNAPQTEIAETDYYTGKIVWDSETTAFAADTVYTAKVTLYAKSADGKQYVFPQELAISQNGAAISGVTISDAQVSFQLTFVKTEKETAESETSGTENGTTQGGNAQSGSNGNTQETTQNGQNNNNNNNNTNANQAQGNAGKAAANTQNGSSGGTVSGGSVSVSGGASSGGSAASVQSTASTTASQSAAASDSDSSNSVTAFTVSPDESMELAISVDELDILSISEGQSADITFDALEDQTFTGTVTSISNTASVNGGVAKYTVEIEVPKDENMRIGMNASATIKVEDKQDILLIPSAALQERGDSTFVYTGQSEDGTLQDEVEVETGLSDGSNVEITSGLSEGDTVYYTRTVGDSQSGDMQGFGGFGDGQMPSMPSDMKGGPGGNGGGDNKGGGQGGPGGTPPNQ